MQATTVERLQELVHRPYDRSRPEIPSDMHYERAELARRPRRTGSSRGRQGQHLPPGHGLPTKGSPSTGLVKSKLT
jgi:hypothetical protein